MNTSKPPASDIDIDIDIDHEANQSQSMLTLASRGDTGAAADFEALLGGARRERAHRRMSKQRAGHTLQTTALINEVWIRLFGTARRAIEGRQHFLKLSSTIMRTVLVDHARRSGSDKRGGQHRRVDMPDDVPVEQASDQVLDLHAALERLSLQAPDQARVAEMRCFGGLSCADISDVLGVSKRTAERSWLAAKAFLSRELSS